MKEIEGFPDYFVTKDGKVYSKKSGKLRELKPHGKGYKHVTLTNGQRKYPDVHRLVAEAYIPNPDNLPQVNHIDENKLNNNVDNLEWVTVSQNNLHSAHQQRKFYIIEKQNGEQFEVFGVRQWCRENGINVGNLYKTHTGRLKWHKGYRLIIPDNQQ